MSFKSCLYSQLALDLMCPVALARANILVFKVNAMDGPATKLLITLENHKTDDRAKVFE